MAREIRADQYGIRTMVAVGDVEIKFEIIFESRITLSKPSLKDQILSIPTLTTLDMATSKLLANSDRWADDSVFSRDLIDLAMLELPQAQRKLALEKAKVPYGMSVEKDLKKSIENLKNRPGRLSECMSALKIDFMPEVVIWERIRSWML